MNDPKNEVADLLGAGRPSQELHTEIIQKWETHMHTPGPSLVWADAAVVHADRLANLVRGEAQSIRGAALAANGDHSEAERCFYRAADLLANQPEEVANRRRLGLLRMIQGSLAEADRLINEALQRARESDTNEEIGKCLLALGYLTYEKGDHGAALNHYLDSLAKLDKETPSYSIAIQNLMIAMVMAEDDRDGIETKINTLLQTRRQLKGLPDEVATHFNWLLSVAEIKIRRVDPARKRLKRVVTVLRKGGRAAELGTALVDLAQAYYLAGDSKETINSLEEARLQLQKIGGIAPSAIANIEEVIAGVKSGVVEPWAARKTEAKVPGEILPGRPGFDHFRALRRLPRNRSERSTQKLARSEQKSSVGAAELYLLKSLSNGPVPAARIIAQAGESGITERTLRRAKKQLGISSLRTGFGRQGTWVWEFGTPIPQRGKEP